MSVSCLSVTVSNQCSVSKLGPWSRIARMYATPMAKPSSEKYDSLLRCDLYMRSLACSDDSTKLMHSAGTIMWKFLRCSMEAMLLRKTFTRILK